MAMSPTQIIGIALRLVSKSNQIASIWGQIAPLVTEIMGTSAAKGLVQQAATPPSPDLSISWLQQSLNTLGQKVAATGQYDDATKVAVSAFQKAHPPLVVDGWAGINTQASIHDEMTKRGAV